MKIHTPNKALYITSIINNFMFASHTIIYNRIPFNDIFNYKLKLRPSLFITEHIKRK